MCRLLNIADYWQKHRPLHSPKGTRYGSEVNKGTTVCVKTHLGISAGWDLGCEHRVGRVLSFFSTRRNWDSPQTLSRRRVCPPLGGGAHSLAREGLGESQFRRGDIHCGTLYTYVLCGCECGSHEEIYVSMLGNSVGSEYMEQKVAANLNSKHVKDRFTEHLAYVFID
jgi:hypothetical protein